MAVTSAILGTLTMALVFTGRAVEIGAVSSGAGRDDAVELSDRIASDLRLARTFTERSATAVAFTVPDRDGDGLDEALRYEWTGIAGDPVTLTYNGSDHLVVAPSVQEFALAYDVTTIPGAGGSDEGATEGGLRMVFVVADAANLTAGELLRRFLFESWDHAVTLVDDDDDASAYEAVLAAGDVVYVSDQVREDRLLDKLNDATIGVITENRDTVDDLDLAEALFATQTGTAIVIDDDGHYITQPFFPGILPILATGRRLIHSDELALAAGARLLASEPERPDRIMLLALDAGEPLYSGDPAAGRRVVLPWSSDTDLNDLNEHGYTLFRRAIEWASGRERADVEEEEEALFAQYENPAATPKDHIVKSDKWAVASIVPDLPDDAITWKITRVRFLAAQKNEATATLVVQVRERVAGGAPGAVIAQAFFSESQLPPVMATFEVAIDMPDSIPADQGACIAIGMLAGDDGAVIRYEDTLGTATPANQYISGNPGGWSSPDPDRDLPIEAFGSTETSIIE